ncbi:MAG TPA: hypothetical protein VHZ07_04320 [Bryobacteraceae bacterium]|jgi:anti-sigma factor RsiW|nr:hypothetical protein [Bryobacteraceae bacterium]
MNCRQITELKARYFCAELDYGDMREFEAHVLGCRECAETIAEEREMDECIRAGILQDTPDTALLETRVRGAIRRQALRGPLVGGAVAAALVLFFALSRPFGSDWQNARLCDDAAGDHFAEIVRQDPRHWRFSASEIDSLAIQQGIKPYLLAALASGEYRLERVKLCRLDGRIFLHAVYRSGRNRVSVYLRASPSANSEAISAMKRHGEYVASLGRAGILAIVVSNASEQAVMSFARSAAMAI